MAATNPKGMPPTHNINTRGAVREQSPTPSRQPPITPPKPVSGFGETGIRSRPSPSPTSNLPERVSARQIQQESFKYGGGRSAGNRSIEANQDKQRKQK
jgi:hypothetical protein